jgi:hypothetical protein
LSPQASTTPRPTLAIVVTAVWSLLLVPGLIGAALSPMFFDAPGSMNDAAAWINVTIVVSFPCLCLAAICGTWLVWLWRRRNPSRLATYAQIAVSCLPLLPVAYVAAALVVETAGVILSGQPLGLHSTIIRH